MVHTKKAMGVIALIGVLCAGGGSVLDSPPASPPEPGSEEAPVR